MFESGQRLLLLHKPGTELSQLRLQDGSKYRGRRLLFVHYNQRRPSDHPERQNLHPKSGQEYKDSAFHQTLRLISKKGYRPQDHAAAFNHLNSNIVLSLFALANPHIVKALTRAQKERAKQACLFTENRNKTTTGGQNLYFAIKAITEKATNSLYPNLSGRPNAEQTRAIINSLVFGSLKEELQHLLENEKHGDYYKATREFIQQGKGILRRKPTLRTDHEIQLPDGSPLRVTIFKNPRYLHPLSGFALAPDAHIVIRESFEPNRYVVFDVQPVSGVKVHFPHAFYEDLRNQERENWRLAGRDLQEYQRDLPRGRGNAGGTSRNHHAELTFKQLLDLMSRHGVIQRRSSE